MDNKDIHLDDKEQKKDKLPDHVIFHTIEKSDKYRKGTTRFPKVRLGIFLVCLLIILGFFLTSRVNYHSLYKSEKYSKIVEQYKKTGKAKAKDEIYIANAMYNSKLSEDALKLYDKIFENKSMDDIVSNKDYSAGLVNYIVLLQQNNIKNPVILKLADKDFTGITVPDEILQAQKEAQAYKAKLDQEEKLAAIRKQIENIKFTINHGPERIVGESFYFIENGVVFTCPASLARDFDITSSLSKGIAGFRNKKRFAKVDMKTGKVVSKNNSVRIRKVDDAYFYSLEDILTSLGFQAKISTGKDEFVVDYK